MRLKKAPWDERTNHPSPRRSGLLHGRHERLPTLRTRHLGVHLRPTTPEPPANAIGDRGGSSRTPKPRQAARQRAAVNKPCRDCGGQLDGNIVEKKVVSTGERVFFHETC